MKFRTINSTEKDLEDLYNDNSLTIEGLREDSIHDFVDDFEFLMREEISCLDVYVTKGALMNRTYGLTGTNAYPDDLSIVSIKLENFREGALGHVAMKRFSCGGRWFNDIVDNNARREREK